MHFNALLLSLAAPAVTAVAHSVVETAHSIGQSFSEVLAGDGPSDPVADPLNEQQPSQLEKLVGGLRKWLQESGISDVPYELRFQLDPSGQSNLDVSGVDSKAIERLVATEPHWQRELRRSAVALQQNAGTSAGRVALATISITERDWSFSTGG